MKESLKIVLFFIIMIWLVEIVNIFMGHSLYSYGILPREIDGLKGIILHPFIHGSLQHIISNSIPLLVLGFFVAAEGRGTFIKATFLILVLGGFFLWLLGRSSYHVGASLLIFGYFGFVITRAFYKQTLTSILIALVTIFLYGGLVYGLVPVNNQISWEGHLFGLIAGIAGAKVLNK